jgi:hypothetical protein
MVCVTKDAYVGELFADVQDGSSSKRAAWDSEVTFELNPDDSG